MRFPELGTVALPATFERYMPGRLHHDGARYLPLIILRLAADASWGAPAGVSELGVVDRHHRVDPAAEGRAGTARLIFQLSRVHLQAAGETRRGLARRDHERGTVSTMPAAFGRVVALPTWEEHDKLGYAAAYTELILDIGIGTVGLRTTLTGPDLTTILGAPRLLPGDWIGLDNSRIDILAFEPDGAAGLATE